MSVYMGEEGTLTIKRTTTSGGHLASVLDPSDVDVKRKRFSFDFPVEALITGDKIVIATADKSSLELVAGHVFPDGEWYCHVDDAGGVRLYNTYQAAINGEFAEALTLRAPTAAQDIVVRTKDNRFRCIAQMRSWELTTSRQQVDTTVLGEDFVSQFSRGLISGQGTIDCIWDHKVALCDPSVSVGLELPHYLCELLLRLHQGSAFRGRFYVYSSQQSSDSSVWYEADCVISNVGLSFSPGQVVGSRIEFVTTGAIDLHTGEPEGFILQEDTDLLLQEDSDPLLVEEAL